MYYVYMLCCGDNSLYTGISNDVERRVAAHAAGRGAKYTKSRLPVQLVYMEACGDKSAALRREAAIRRLNRAQKLALVEIYQRSTLSEAAVGCKTSKL